MATDGNVAQSGAFPGSSQRLMAWWVSNLELVHRRDTCHRRFGGKESLQRLTNWIYISSTTSVDGMPSANLSLCIHHPVVVFCIGPSLRKAGPESLKEAQRGKDNAWDESRWSLKG